MNPMQELVKAAEAMLHHLNDDSFDPSFAGRTHRRREALRAAIPAAKLYAERMGEVVEFIRAAFLFGDVSQFERMRKDAKILLASLDSAEVGESAGGGTTSPDVIREAKREAWEEYLSCVVEKAKLSQQLSFDGRREVMVIARSCPNPYAPPTATAKETNDDES